MALDLFQTIASGTIALVSALGAAAVLRKRLSKDSTERTKDRTEATFVELLLKERDAAQQEARLALEQAREAWRVRQVDVESIARLTAQTLYQQKEIERLNREFTSFKSLIARLYPQTRHFLESGTGNLDDLPTLPIAGGRRGVDLGGEVFGRRQGDKRVSAPAPSDELDEQTDR